MDDSLLQMQFDEVLEIHNRDEAARWLSREVGELVVCMDMSGAQVLEELITNLRLMAAWFGQNEIEHVEKLFGEATLGETNF